MSNGSELKNKAPAFQFYPKDYLTDTKVLMMPLAAQGLYVQLLCLDWIEDGLTEAELKALCGGHQDIDAIAIAMLCDCFVKHPTKAGHLSNPRLQRERISQAENREKRTQSGKKGANARWGNNLTRVANASKPHSERNANGIAKDGSSSSTSSSSSIYNNPSASITFPPKLDTPECRAAWASWLEHKKSKGQKYKSRKTQEQALRNWAEGPPSDFIAAINFSIGSNYGGIFADPKHRTQKLREPNLDVAESFLRKASGNS